ncbi:MAG: SpoIIE family protein phosphatase, partial [Saprospiraceae bacterium]|nr:SpoIIE family protein phosphatase [Saprospiraceae bacterium]
MSGDFYWFTQQEDKIIIAAVDCTGHGVPGAFMSMVGNTLLNQIVIERGITRPAEILNQLHQEIRSALKQEEDSYSRDGMDIALCTIHQDVHILEFAGANRPLFFLKNQALEEIAGDKMSIGGVRRHNERPFQNHIIKLQEGEECTIYLSSDGYADQFGGAQNRKFMVRNFKRLLVELSRQQSLKSQHLNL